MSNDTLVRTCTVGPNATTGERCGEPAVTTFTGRNGEVYAECLAHACLSSTPAHQPEVGPRLGQPVVIDRGRFAGRCGVIDAMTPVHLDVCLAPSARIVRVRRDSVSLF